MDSALKVMKGVNINDQANQDAVKRFKGKKRQELDLDEYIDGIVKGNITVLSKAITLVESSRQEHRQIAQNIIEKALPYSGNSIRVGITGIPGVGKSTFIEAFGNYVVEKGHKLAVLAVDPSSERSKGSILGDKTRMEKLAAHKNAFIRPSPSSGTLGGVAQKTRESIVLCEAAGFDVIFVETVGVGQSETAVSSMVDLFLLLMLAGAGDELQGIKRGIMEMADIIAITKADGDNKEKAMRAQAEYTNAVHFLPQRESGWTTLVKTCSSLQNKGMAELWETMGDYFTYIKKNAYFQNKRLEQNRFWMYETIEQSLKNSFYGKEEVKNSLEKMELMIKNNEISPFSAAEKLLNKYFNQH